MILFIALIERRYVLFMEKTSENTVQVWKNKKIKHWMLIAFFLCFYDIVAVNLSYIFGLFIRFDLTFSAIPKEYMLAYVKFAPIYTAFCVVVFFVFKLYNSLWRFASIGELSRIFLASIVTTIFQTDCWYNITLHENACGLLYSRSGNSVRAYNSSAFCL